MELEKQLAAIIRDWVVDNFGESEAADPSWNIAALAQHITGNLTRRWCEDLIDEIKGGAK